MKTSSIAACFLLVATSVFTTAVLPSAHAGSLIINGDLESWGTLGGTPPQGSPTGWAGAGTVIRTSGLVAGSTYAGVVQGGQSGLYSTTLLETPSQFQLSFVIAATDPGSGRSFNLQLQRDGGTTIMNIRAVRGSSAGKLTLQAFDSSLSWTNLVQDLDASVYVGSSTNSFTTLNAYNLLLDVNLSGTPSYSLTYGAVGGTQTTLSNLTYFQAPAAGGTLFNIGFAGSGSAAGSYTGIDNIVAISVPEPGAISLLLLGAVGALVVYVRRSRLSSTGAAQ